MPDLVEGKSDIEVVTPPAVEPVSVAEAKAHCRVDVNDDDALIQRLTVDAREWAERYTRRALVTQVLRLHLNGFPRGRVITLPGGKVQAVSSVKYLSDPEGELLEVDAGDYRLLAHNPDRIAALVPAAGKEWPAASAEPSSVQVEYIAGYGAAAAVPATIRQAILLHVGWSYDSRQPETFGTTGAAIQIMNHLELKLADYRLFEFA